MLAAFGTLYATPMFNNLGFQGAGSLLGGLVCLGSSAMPSSEQDF